MRHLIRTAVLLALALLGPMPQAPAVAGSRAADPARIEFLDVGQGDSVLIRSPEGKTALIDAGTSNRVVQTLKDREVTTLDLVAVSHHHSDHYGGMAAVIQAFHPRYFLATSSGHNTSSYQKLIKLVRDEKLQPIYPLKNKPRRIELGSVVLTVFPQPPEDDDEENNNSIGLRVSFGSVSVLMTGDSEETERQWWMAHNPDLLRDASILKLAHHGSRNGTDAKWLGLVQPELTVASLGEGNDYGHPHSETVSLLSRSHIPFKRTDRDGTIAIECDGDQWQLVRGQSQIARNSDTSDDKKGSAKGNGWRSSSSTKETTDASSRRR